MDLSYLVNILFMVLIIVGLAALYWYSFTKQKSTASARKYYQELEKRREQGKKTKIDERTDTASNEWKDYQTQRIEDEVNSGAEGKGYLSAEIIGAVVFIVLLVASFFCGGG